jgi:hypothetical protein
MKNCEYRYIANGLQDDMEEQRGVIRKLLSENKSLMDQARGLVKIDLDVVGSHFTKLCNEVSKLEDMAGYYLKHLEKWTEAAPNVDEVWDE